MEKTNCTAVKVALGLALLGKGQEEYYDYYLVQPTQTRRGRTAESVAGICCDCYLVDQVPVRYSDGLH